MFTSAGGLAPAQETLQADWLRTGAPPAAASIAGYSGMRSELLADVPALILHDRSKPMTRAAAIVHWIDGRIFSQIDITCCYSLFSTHLLTDAYLQGVVRVPA